MQAGHAGLNVVDLGSDKSKSNSRHRIALFSFRPVQWNLHLLSTHTPRLNLLLPTLACLSDADRYMSAHTRGYLPDNNNVFASILYTRSVSYIPHLVYQLNQSG